MKMLLKTSAFVIIMFTALWILPQKVSAQNENVSLQVFYDELSSYGTWVDNPDYGYVWVPNVEPGFRPYVTNGHWVFTDYGWTWSSDYPWGWAAFHYGRWQFDPQYGNIWIPDTEWGPAWVVWRQSPGYYGWAPMAPGMSMGSSYGRNYIIPSDRWCFVRDRDLTRYDIGNYFIDRLRYRTLIGISNLLFNVHYDAHFSHSYVYGPERADFQRRYGREISPVRIYDHDRPGQSVGSDRFSIYRPQFNKRGDAYNNARPSNLRDRERVGHNDNYNNRNSDYNKPGRSNASDNNNSNYNNRNWNNNNSGRGTQQNTVTTTQNDREKTNALNNNNSVNRSRDQQQQNNGANNSQRGNFNNRNQSGTNAAQQNQTVNQNQRDANKVAAPANVDNSQKTNQQGRPQGNLNSGNNPNTQSQPKPNVQTGPQRKDGVIKAKRLNESPIKGADKVNKEINKENPAGEPKK